MNNIIFISGIARSGTTILGDYLSRNFHTFFAGEVLTNREFHRSRKSLAAYRSRNRKCTCGEFPENCKFWSDLIPSFNDDISIYYKRCLERKNQIAGDIPFIDSSKNLSRLKQIIKVINYKENNIHVIHSIKNYRAQIYSGLKYGKIKKRNILINNIFYYGAYWAYSNLYAIFYLYYLKSQCKITDFSIIFYEDFIFNKDKVFSMINKKMQFLKIKDNEVKSYLSHEIGGNDGFVKGNSNKIYYQHEWIFTYNIFLPIIAILLEPVQVFIRYFSEK